MSSVRVGRRRRVVVVVVDMVVVRVRITTIIILSCSGRTLLGIVVSATTTTTKHGLLVCVVDLGIFVKRTPNGPIIASRCNVRVDTPSCICVVGHKQNGVLWLHVQIRYNVVPNAQAVFD